MTHLIKMKWHGPTDTKQTRFTVFSQHSDARKSVNYDFMSGDAQRLNAAWDYFAANIHHKDDPATRDDFTLTPISFDSSTDLVIIQARG